MIQLPPGFDVNQLVSDFISIYSPFVAIFFIIASYFLLIKILKRV